MIPAHPKRTIAFVCPGCLTTFHLYVWEIEEGVPKCNYCVLPLETSEGQNAKGKEYRLEEALYPALLAVLEGIFGKEYIANAIARAKFYRNPGTAKAKPQEKGMSEVIE
jgi:hypothetical protein